MSLQGNKSYLGPKIPLNHKSYRYNQYVLKNDKREKSQKQKIAPNKSKAKIASKTFFSVKSAPIILMHIALVTATEWLKDVIKLSH